MLLRKLVAALCPLLLCVITCAAFRWLDGWLGAGSFLAFAVKGLLLGAALGAHAAVGGHTGAHQRPDRVAFAGRGADGARACVSIPGNRGRGARAAAQGRFVHQRAGGAG